MKLVRNDVYWNKDSNGNISPISVIDKYVIDSIDSTVQLKDIPVFGTINIKKVITILNQNDAVKEYVEITNGNVSRNNEFKVNYTTNEIQFHSSQKGCEIMVKCLSEGGVGSSAKNVYMKNDSDGNIGDNVEYRLLCLNSDFDTLSDETRTSLGDMKTKVSNIENGLANGLESKVDKVEGKGLSDCNYSDDEKKEVSKIKDKANTLDNRLTTNAKDIVLAINELNARQNVTVINNSLNISSNNIILDKKSSEYDVDVIFSDSFGVYSDTYTCAMRVKDNVLYFEGTLKRLNTSTSNVLENLPFEIKNFQVNTFVGQVMATGWTTCKPILLVTEPKQGNYHIVLEFTTANISGANTVGGCAYLVVNGSTPIQYKKGVDVNYSNVDRIKNMMGSKFVSFSDSHTSTSNSSTNIGALKKIRTVNKCNEDINSLFALSLGDVIDDNVTSDKTSHLKGLTSIRRALLPNTLFVQGNHCTNGNNNDKTIANLCTPQDLFKTQTLGKTGISYTPRGEKENYFLYDDNINKVRYIMLNTHDVPTDISTSNASEYKYNLFTTYAIRQKQIEWLIYALNTDYDVVICSHVGLLNETELPDENTGVVKNSDLVRTILKAFKDKTKGNVTKEDGDFSINANYDFTHSTSGKVVMSMFGHFHYEVNFLDTDGIRHIGMEDMYGDISYTTTKNYCKDFSGRVPNSETDCALKLINIDSINKQVTILPIGVGSEVTFNY